MKASIKELAILIAAVIGMTACGNNSTDNTTKTDSSVTSTSTPMAPMPADTARSASSANANPDQDVVNNMVTKNTMEIAWLKAGIAKGGAAVKDHAKMMLADHTKLAGEVTALVGKKGLSAPNVDTANAVTINDKSGKDFDKAWTDKMVADHQGLLADLNKAKGDVKDEDLRALVTRTIPVVQKHLDMAQMMEGKMK